MKAKRNAIAGSLESSDVLVTIAPAEGATLDLQIESIVLKQYGRRIRAVVEDLMAQAGLSAASVRIQDRGALECTLRARVETAIERATA
jgi:citrate lyase subunit gamma (acyl carrier protein)